MPAENMIQFPNVHSLDICSKKKKGNAACFHLCLKNFSCGLNRLPLGFEFVSVDVK